MHGLILAPELISEPKGHAMVRDGKSASTQREVCHKHRNIRRENDLRVRAEKAGSGVCSFLS
jgi:hypothetical protein